MQMKCWLDILYNVVSKFWCYYSCDCILLKLGLVATWLKCGIKHVLANLTYGPMLYEWNVLKIICLDKLASFALKYKCLKVTFLFFLWTLDEANFPSLLDQETKFLLIIILYSISPGELGTDPSKRVIILTLFLPFSPFSLGLAPLGHLGHQFPKNWPKEKFQPPTCYCVGGSPPSPPNLRQF